MGGTKDFVEKRIFEYKSIGTVGGFKIIEGVDNRHNLPNFSNTSTGYVKLSNNVPHTIRLYKNRKKFKDIDWGHANGNFKTGSFHVHDYKNGVRVHKGRKPSKHEFRIGMMVRYGVQRYV